MTTQRVLRYTLPGTPDDVLERCRTPEVAQRRAQAEPELNGRVTELSHGGDSGALLVFELTADIPMVWLPAAAANALADRPQIVRREVWQPGEEGAIDAEMTFTLTGVPATTATAAARLLPRDGSSELIYNIVLSVGIPFVGSTIERAVLDRIESAFAKESHVLASG